MGWCAVWARSQVRWEALSNTAWCGWVGVRCGHGVRCGGKRCPAPPAAGGWLDEVAVSSVRWGKHPLCIAGNILCALRETSSLPTHLQAEASEAHELPRLVHVSARARRDDAAEAGGRNAPAEAPEHRHRLDADHLRRGGMGREGVWGEGGYVTAWEAGEGRAGGRDTASCTEQALA
eukprot:363294-Chlamydomonas_euryale.AAC.2